MIPVRLNARQPKSWAPQPGRQSAARRLVLAGENTNHCAILFMSQALWSRQALPQGRQASREHTGKGQGMGARRIVLPFVWHQWRNKCSLPSFLCLMARPRRAKRYFKILNFFFKLHKTSFGGRKIRKAMVEQEGDKKHSSNEPLGQNPFYQSMRAAR